MGFGWHDPDTVLSCPRFCPRPETSLHAGIDEPFQETEHGTSIVIYLADFLVLCIEVGPCSVPFCPSSPHCRVRKQSGPHTPKHKAEIGQKIACVAPECPNGYIRCLFLSLCRFASSGSLNVLETDLLPPASHQNTGKVARRPWILTWWTLDNRVCVNELSVC